MAKSDFLENGILKLIYQNSDLANIGDVTGLQGSTTAGNVYVALYTTDPADDNSGTEASYTGYARIAVVRSAAGWDVTDNTASNAALITFGTNTGTSQTITHFATMTASTGGSILHHGQLATPLVCENGNIPKFEIGDLQIIEN